MAHKKQYFRFRCPASFAIMMQGVTPTHIVPFGHFGFTAKYKRTSYQNDTDNFSLGYPMTKSVVSVIACQTCLSYETDKPPFLYFPAASLVDNASCLSCNVGISPDRLQAFRLRCRARLHDHQSGVVESNHHKHTSAPASLTGHYLPSCSWMRESRSLRGVHLVTGVYTSTYTLFPFESRR